MPAPNTAAEIGRERAIALVRTIAGSAFYAPATSPFEWHQEARAILALLPKPVDPDEAEARAIFAKHYPGARYESAGTKELAAGIECIKRGRELALKARAVGEGL